LNYSIIKSFSQLNKHRNYCKVLISNKQIYVNRREVFIHDRIYTRGIYIVYIYSITVVSICERYR
jgi:hypothetical protein